MTSELTDAQSSHAVLSLAQKLHDELLEDARTKAERLVSDANEQISTMLDDAASDAEKLISDAAEDARKIQEEADREALELLTSAKERAEKTLSELEESRHVLTEEISRLQAFEVNYREALKTLVEDAQSALSNSVSIPSETPSEGHTDSTVSTEEEYSV